MTPSLQDSPPSSSDHTHVEEFRALSLILQHRKLLLALKDFEDQLADLRRRAQQPNGGLEGAERLLVRSLRRFVDHLTEHFAAEARSTADIFLEHPNDALLRALRELDSEHPELFRRFLEITLRIEGEEGPHEVIWEELEGAIAAFRRHEEREDELFGLG